MSIWDDPELQIGGEFVTFENPGDMVSGTIHAIRRQRFEDGSVCPQILLTTDDGEERTVTAGQIRLKAELSRLRPEAGDHIRIRFESVEKRGGGKTLKHFLVEVRPGQGQAAQPSYGQVQQNPPQAGTYGSNVPQQGYGQRPPAQDPWGGQQDGGQPPW